MEDAMTMVTVSTRTKHVNEEHMSISRLNLNSKNKNRLSSTTCGEDFQRTDWLKKLKCFHQFPIKSAKIWAILSIFAFFWPFDL